MCHSPSIVRHRVDGCRVLSSPPFGVDARLPLRAGQSTMIGKVHWIAETNNWTRVVESRWTIRLVSRNGVDQTRGAFLISQRPLPSEVVPAGPALARWRN